MRYLLVTRDFPPKPGGMSAYYGGLASHFPKDGIAVVRPRGPSGVEQGGGVGRYRIWYERMKEVYRRYPFDVVLCGNFGVLSYPVFVFHKLFGTPYFLFFHGNDVLMLRRRLKLNPAKRPLVYLVFGGAAGVITNSHFTLKLVGEVLPLRSKPALVLHPGVPDEFLGLKDTAEPFSRGTITLLTVARLAWRKGIHMVIRALGSLARDFPNLRYEVVGGGDGGGLRDLARRTGVEDKVVLRGFVDRRELMEIYRSSDIFVMPSLYDRDGCEVEGFGIAFLEAGAFALPVLGSRTGGIPEAVLDGRTGRLVPSDFSEEDLADVLRWMMSHREESVEMGRRGYERVNSEFTYAGKVAQLISFTEGCLRGCRGSCS
ncbi:MAG: hypothetical protein DRQ08_05890 [Candidatus Latescibacterota bacterium]|nr:MAG: hypothetical protein DRQ08_05890 [Candidatus Latescibacterota bacterium]